MYILIYDMETPLRRHKYVCNRLHESPLIVKHSDIPTYRHTYIYTIILLTSVALLANCRSQFLLDRFGRCLKLFVSNDSPSCHEFASQFGQAIFYT